MFLSEIPHNCSGSRRSERRGGGGVVPMSDVNFNKYPFSQSFKVLDKYYLIPLEKGPTTEYVVFKIP